MLFTNLAWVISAAETLRNHSEQEPLLRRQHTINNNPDEAFENSTSRKFRLRIERLTRKFRKFDTVSDEKKQELLNQWRTEFRNLEIQEGLWKAGFHEGLRVSEETLQKFSRIKSRYPVQKSSTCTLF